MMHLLFRLFLLLIILTSLGCQNLKDSLKSLVTLDDQNHQMQRLLNYGEQYNELGKEQRRSLCKKLKQDFKTQDNWETAWLLVYSLNDNFNCVSLKESLSMLNSIQNAKNPNKHLQWINKNQIKLLNNLNNFQKQNNKVHKRNRYIHTKLDQSKQQLEELNAKLEELNAKIQELKAIETSIYKKTQ